MGILRLKDVTTREVVPGYHAKMVHSENMTLVYWDIKAGYVLPDHSHPHEQVVNLLEGKFELTISGETKVMEPETVAIIPSNAPHTGKGITDCRVLDVFYPVREDYK